MGITSPKSSFFLKKTQIVLTGYQRITFYRCLFLWSASFLMGQPKQSWQCRHSFVWSRLFKTNVKCHCKNVRFLWHLYLFVCNKHFLFFIFFQKQFQTKWTNRKMTSRKTLVNENPFYLRNDIFRSSFPEIHKVGNVDILLFLKF